MATYSEMFPSQFERLYNLPRHYAPSGVHGRTVSLEGESEDRRAFQRLEHEQALMSSSQARQSRDWRPLSLGSQPSLGKTRQNPVLKQSIYGGAVTEQGQEMVREVLKRRAQNYRELDADQPYTRLPVRTEPLSPFNLIDTDLSNAIVSVSYGDLTAKPIELFQKALTGLLAKGNELSEEELQVLFSKLGDASDLEALRFVITDASNVPGETPEETRVRKMLRLYFDLIQRSLLFLIKYSNNDARERSLQQNVLRKEASAYFQRMERAAASVSARASMIERRRPSPRQPQDPFTTPTRRKLRLGREEILRRRDEREARRSELFGAIVEPGDEEVEVDAEDMIDEANDQSDFVGLGKRKSKGRKARK